MLRRRLRVLRQSFYSLQQLFWLEGILETPLPNLSSKVLSLSMRWLHCRLLHPKAQNEGLATPQAFMRPRYYRRDQGQSAQKSNSRKPTPTRWHQRKCRHTDLKHPGAERQDLCTRAERAATWGYSHCPLIRGQKSAARQQAVEWPGWSLEARDCRPKIEASRARMSAAPT